MGISLDWLSKRARVEPHPEERSVSKERFGGLRLVAHLALRGFEPQGEEG
jgi:hypothetical protein